MGYRDDDEDDTQVKGWWVWPAVAVGIVLWLTLCAYLWGWFIELLGGCA